MSAIFDRAMSSWREMRAAFEIYRIASYDCAVEACGGVLVNAAGAARDVDSYSLFIGSSARAHIWASDELIEHWRGCGRMTVEDFEQQYYERELA